MVRISNQKKSRVLRRSLMPEKEINFGVAPDDPGSSACDDPLPVSPVIRMDDLDWTRLRLAAAKIVRDGPTSVDIVQTVRVRLIERSKKDRESFERIECLQAYAMTAVRHAALNWVYRRKKERPLEEWKDTSDSRDDPAVKFDKAEIVRLVNKLPETQRIPFLLCHVYGMDDEEVAAELGIKPSAVRKRIQRAYQFLRTVSSDPPRPRSSARGFFKRKEQS
jgi:RNA polymerase sigma factor (sigma-70 family)